MSTPHIQATAGKLLLEALNLPEEPRQSNAWNRLVIAAADTVINKRKKTFSQKDRELLVDAFAGYLEGTGHGQGLVHSHTLEQKKPGKLTDARLYHGPAEVIADQFTSLVDRSLRFSKADTGRSEGIA